MPVKTRPFGPSPADVMIVGEAPGAEEEIKGIPFVGSSGMELTKMLHEAGLVRTEVFLTNVCKYRPPMNDIAAFFLDKKLTQPNELIKEGLQELEQEINIVKPKLILAMGNTPLWALTGNRGITKWRGSMLTRNNSMLMPTYHPAMILREWSWRATAVHDLRRAAQALQNGGWPKVEKRFHVRPSFPDVLEILHMLLAKAEKDPLKLASDLETRGKRIACHGIAWSTSDALCIPFMCVERVNGYWTEEQELAIWELQRRLLTHPNVRIVGQNYLYDAQYFAKEAGYVPRIYDDTLLMQNVAFPGQPKGLDYLSSMYRQFHRYWKDEGKNWDAKQPEEQLWVYNCEDGVATYEASDTLESVLKQLKLYELYRFQMEVWQVAFEMMLRGIRINKELRSKLAGEMLTALSEREGYLAELLGYPLNVRSPKQVHDLFYNQFRCRVIKARTTKKPTANDEALETWSREEPLLRVVTQPIADIRSLGVVNSNVIQAELDPDGRIRSLFDPTKETFRWGSSENAFGGGTNLQNWTKGDEDKEESALRPGQAIIPNVRKLAAPDPGCEIASIDLTGADAQTVAWEADDEELKKVFRENKIKIHAHNAKAVFKEKAPTGYEQPYYDYIRTGVHLVNYVGSAPTLAAALNTSIQEAKWFMNYWFTLHPGILEWHERIADQLMRTRAVYNAFGYRRFYFDRVQEILPEAIAWIGQSTTACVTNRALVAMRNAKELMRDLRIEILLQVHDEIVFQYPIPHRTEALRNLKPLVHITVPYQDPLVIPWGLKTSTASWGDCQKADWPN